MYIQKGRIIYWLSEGVRVTEPISGPPNYVITSLDFYVSADVLVGFFFFLTLRKPFIKFGVTFLGQKQCSSSPLGGDAIEHLMFLTCHVPDPHLHPKSEHGVQNSVMGWFQRVCPDFIDHSLNAFRRVMLFLFIKWYPCNTFMTVTDWQVTWGYWEEMGQQSTVFCAALLLHRAWSFQGIGQWVPLI